MVATAAALGIAAAVVGTAAAADQVSYVNVPSDFSQPLGIAAGPDGNMWFADAGAQSIGKLAPGGVPQLVGLAFPPGAPAGITSGPDGNLWFTEFGELGATPPEHTARVSKISTGNAVERYTLSGPASNLKGIASGPDGALYAAAHDSDALWRVTTTGASTNQGLVPNATGVARGSAVNQIYVTSDAFGGGVYRKTIGGGAPELIGFQSDAHGIALGPDGNFYVTHQNGVAKMTQAGGGLGGGVGVPGSDSRGIAAGPDGAMWFAQFATDTVGRLSTSGDYRAIPVPGCDGPEGVAAGPDGAVYVTCFGSTAPLLVRGRTIVRITQNGAVAPVTPVTPVVPVAPVAPGRARAVPVAGLRGGFSFNKKKVIAGKRFTVSVKFNRAVAKSRVRVQIRSANIKRKGAIKRFKTIRQKLVTGTRTGLPVKIAKPGVYLLRVTYANGPRTVNVKAVKVTVKKKPPARR